MNIDEKILLTGGSGFIGSHLTERLIEDGYKISVFDIWKSKEIANLEEKYSNLTFIKGDINDLYKQKELLKKHDILINFASILGTSETITTYAFQHTLQTNLVASVNLLEEISLLGKRMIIPTTPDVKWSNPYKITKRALEEFACLYASEKNTNVTCMKLGNVYGPRERWLEAKESNDFIEAPFFYQKIIPSFIMDALQNKNITIYGDGTQKSEYIYVDDVVEAFIRLIKSSHDLHGEVLHIGSGINYSVLDIAETLEKIWGKKLTRNFKKMRKGETREDIIFDPEPFQDHLGFKLQYTLEDGLAKTIPYYEQVFSDIKTNRK